MYAADQLKIAGNMTWSSPAYPSAGKAGAFDGGRAYWSSAIATGGQARCTSISARLTP
jgi:hypothetical protein